jgi:hypothetical protein
VLGIVLASCGSFLDETSQDQIVAKTARDYSEMIYGEVYSNMSTTAGISSYLDIMTDDCQEYAAKPSTLYPDNRINAFGYWTWQQIPELPYQGVLQEDKTWATFYRQIFLTNITLHDLPDLPGTAEEKTYLKGECHLIRAFAYFMLVNIFGEPYNPATASTDKGVPINNLTSIDIQSFPRSSVAEVYEQIKADLRDGLEALKISDNSKSVFRWNYLGACTFASRVALYMKEYDEVIRYTNKVLETKTNLYNLEEKMKNNVNLYFHNSANPEILFSYGYYNIASMLPSPNAMFQASTALMNLYVTGDLRASKGTTTATRNGQFIRAQGRSNYWKNTQYKYYNPTTTLTFAFAVKVSEAYLNRAEAYACKENPELDKAVADINKIRENRFTTAAYKPLAVENQQVVIDLVRRERRLELCFEMHRWFDLRRYDDRPRITHTFRTDPGDANSALTYVLEPDDPAWVLPVPQSVLQLDPVLDDIRRPERNPVEQ